MAGLAFGAAVDLVVLEVAVSLSEMSEENETQQRKEVSFMGTERAKLVKEMKIDVSKKCELEDVRVRF